MCHDSHEQDISSDPSRTPVVISIKRPKNTTEVAVCIYISEFRTFMGVTNQLGKLSPKLTKLSADEKDGCGAQHRRMPLMQSGWSWQPLQLTILTQPLKIVETFSEMFD